MVLVEYIVFFFFLFSSISENNLFLNKCSNFGRSITNYYVMTVVLCKEYPLSIAATSFSNYILLHLICVGALVACLNCPKYQCNQGDATSF